MTSTGDEAPQPSPTDDPYLTPRYGIVRRLLGTSRFLILLAVVGSFIASAILMLFGAMRSIVIVTDFLSNWRADEKVVTHEYGKTLLVETVSLIDLFLLGTVLFIISAGLYQLFIDDQTPLPRWLKIHTLDNLKSLLSGVIIVALLVTFLGAAVDWHGGTDIIAIGLAVAAVIFAASFAMRHFESGPPGEKHG